ncbi:MAG: hypothetical protein LAO18_12355, partial [Acidobacteriia bacterium]|nr:hypothetical protein [Terriglobia bacterium]
LLHFTLSQDRTIEETKHQDPRLISLAQEWARLRQRAQTERDPAKVIVIVDRLKALLSEAEQLISPNGEPSSRNVGSEVIRAHD